ncbi:MAG TPA: hypothetical protein VJR67_01070 [Candidatus Nitrosopolaris sp.]|nr:hypothetical protein [Candidatus Nitrosopolaris sp.]
MVCSITTSTTRYERRKEILDFHGNWIDYNTFVHKHLNFSFGQYDLVGHMVLPNNFAKMAKDVLSIDDSIDAVSIMDRRGNTLSSVSKGSLYSVKYRITEDVKNMAGAWAIVILGMTQRMDQIFGRSEAVVSLHKRSKLMLVPVSSHQLLIGLVVYRSSNEEYIIAKIRTLLGAQDNIDLNQRSNLGR